MSKENPLPRMFDIQRAFSENFFSHNENTLEDRERLTMQFAASLQKEVGDLLEGINYRHHRAGDKPPSIAKIKHEAIDAFRYLIGIMNIWDITPADFEDAFNDRAQHLQMRHSMEQTKWEGQPVIIFDIDDVIVPFRTECGSWVTQNTEFAYDDENKSYYSITQEMYMRFINAGGLRSIRSNNDIVNVINRLYDEGFWIQLLTARPKDNLACKYDTFAWLNKSNLKCHRLSFSPEKYLWLANTPYYAEGKVVCAVDDSPKHAREFASHGIPTLSPRTPSNGELEDVKGIRMYDTAGGLYNFIQLLKLRETS